MRLLLVEDDLELAATLRHVLVSAGASVDVARDGKTGLRLACENRYAVIVLDLMLPNLSGLELCAAFRQRRGTTPILMTTARDSVDDRVRGLETGADDYLPKPFDVREFLARVHALARRDRMQRARVLRAGPLRLDTQTRTATLNGEGLALTRVEYGILEALAGHASRVVTREALLEGVWQDSEPGSNKLDVAVRALRRKLDSAGLPDLIQTVYGVGYTIDPSQEDRKRVQT